MYYYYIPQLQLVGKSMESIEQVGGGKARTLDMLIQVIKKQYIYHIYVYICIHIVYIMCSYLYVCICNMLV